MTLWSDFLSHMMLSAGLAAATAGAAASPGAAAEAARPSATASGEAWPEPEVESAPVVAGAQDGR